MPAIALNNSAVRFCVPPTLMVPTLSVPGFSFAALRTSPSVWYGEAALTMKWQVIEQRHADRGAVGQERQRIAVGAARQRGAGRGNAAGAGHVLDDEILPELFAQGLRDKPCRDVDNA